MSKPETAVAPSFLRRIIQADLDVGERAKIVTRFPPKPNGYLHVGYAKPICLNFGLVQELAGDCHLHFDDANPAREDQGHIDAIKTDIKWLGFQWSGEVCYTPNYFDQLHAWAVGLIKAGKVFVCNPGPEEMREYYGTLTEPGRNSPYRDRSVGKNLDLFTHMKAGESPDGARSLRMKVDMGSPNMNLCDPILYRIRHAHHHQTGDRWRIYPSYNFTHDQLDIIEGITHSICTLEFEDCCPFYEWLLANLPVPAQPYQYEFSRLDLNYTMTSERKLKQLVNEGRVDGWDDPRISTLFSYRRRGYTPESIRNSCEMIGMNHINGVVGIGMLEFSIRNHLDATASRAICMLKSLEVVIISYSEGQVEDLELPRCPEEDVGVHVLSFGRELSISTGDFEEVPPVGHKRLIPDGEVRLCDSYVIRADEAIRNAGGNIVELCCSYDPDTLGKDPEGCKVKGVIRWVPAEGSTEYKVRLYDRLFRSANLEKAGEDGSFLDNINADSLQVPTDCRTEPSLGQANPEDCFQFEREGHFVADLKDSRLGKPVFSRTVTLRDSWGQGWGRTVLQIYNTLSETKEVLTPLVGNQVRMYVYSMTMYDCCHLDHSRSMVMFDVITRWLHHRGYDLTYVCNIIGIDDKVINRANKNGEPFDILTKRMIAAMHEDEARLSILKPDQEPRATDYIAGMHAMIQTLIDKDYTYAPGNDGMYYRVGRFAGHSKLSRRRVENLCIGVRIEPGEAKEDPLDFVLWKGAKSGEPSWSSLQDEGHPDWHIECSVMPTRCLGDSFDIHDGGSGLGFSHYENEIAQSEAVTGEPYAKS